MEPKQRLFIYDRKEMAVLVLLGVMVALFAFTLGVHLGKKVGPSHVVTGAEHGHGDGDSSAPVQTESDKVPENPEIAAQASGVPDAVDESLDQALHDEVAKTGIQLEQSRPVDLPKKTRSANGGATSGTSESKTATSPGDSSPVKTAIHEAVSSLVTGKYTLQVGSHQNKDEAEEQIHLLEEHGLKPFLRTVDLKKKGQWHRVFVGGFESKEDAEKTGKRFKAENVIVSFVVAPRPQ